MRRTSFNDSWRARPKSNQFMERCEEQTVVIRVASASGEELSR
jgi:hypothetical protein